MANTIRAGRIVGNPSDGLCERICIEVRRVFDGCRESADNNTYTFVLSDISAAAIPPFTFVSAYNGGDARFDNVTETALAGGLTRAEGDIVIPVTVSFTDANSDPYTARSELKLHRTFVLNTPDSAVVPYRYSVLAALRSEIGSFTSNDTASITLCYTFVIKVVADVDVMVPSYGYAVYPDCGACDGDICRQLLGVPLFPTP